MYTHNVKILILHVQLTELVLQVVTLYYGGHLVINNEITGGELVSLLLYQVSLTAALDVSMYLIIMFCIILLLLILEF